MSFPDIYDWRTEENYSLLESFRAHDTVVPWLKEWHCDDYLIRWLIARDFKVDKAAQFFAVSMAWREEFEVDGIIERMENEGFVMRLEKFWPGSEPGEVMASDGTAVYVKRMGQVDPKSIPMLGNPDEIRLWHIYTQEVRERFRVEQREKYGFSWGAIWLSDLTGLGWKHLSKPILGLFKMTKDIDANNYPESVRKMIIFNTPKIFPVAWSITKTILDKNTLKKVSVEKGNIRSILLELMDEQDIPDYCGGERLGVATGGDRITEVTDDIFFDDVDNPDEVSIPAGCTFEIPVKIKSPTHIGWKFCIDTYDIEMYITYQRSRSHPLEEVFRYDSRMEKDENQLELTRGYYNIIFDNQYSWTRSKQMKYSIFLNDHDETSQSHD